MHGTLPHKLKTMPTDEYMRLISVMNFERQLGAQPAVKENGIPPEFAEETIDEVISWKATA